MEWNEKLKASHVNMDWKGRTSAASYPASLYQLNHCATSPVQICKSLAKETLGDLLLTCLVQLLARKGGNGEVEGFRARFVESGGMWLGAIRSRSQMRGKFEARDIKASTSR